MIKQPLIEYIEKHVLYIPNSIVDPYRHWSRPIHYDSKDELIKVYTNNNGYNVNCSYLSKRLFRRYMNNFYWNWDND